MKPDWQSDDGSIRLWCADCLDVLHTWEDGAVDAVVTDPPYGIGGYVSTPSKWRRRAGAKSESWDSATVDLQLVVDLSPRALVWGGNNYALPPSRNFLCWYKPDAPPSMAQCEYAWCSWDGNASHVSCSISSTNPERNGHPTQKPLRVMLASLSHLKDDCGVIADPFMGSGTTGVACIRTGRHFWGIEKDPKYFEIAVKRMQDELDRFPLLEGVKSQPTQGELFAQINHDE